MEIAPGRQPESPLVGVESLAESFDVLVEIVLIENLIQSRVVDLDLLSAAWATRMTNTVGAIAGVVLICAASALAGPMQSRSVQTGRLNPRIGPADAQRYKSIQDGKDWENPYLVTGPDGIYVKAKGLSAAGKTVAAADLERTLVGLPVTAWPYGRVVAVQEPSLRTGDRSDDKPIADNLAAALAILKSLDVTVDRWPS